MARRRTSNNPAARVQVQPQPLMAAPVPAPRRTAVINTPKPSVLRTMPTVIYANGYKNRQRFGGSFFDRVSRVLIDSLNNPMVITMIGIILAILISHLNDPNNGPLSRFINGLIDNPSTKELGNWLKANINRFLGFLTFLPAVFSVQRKDRTMVFISVLIWIFVTPYGSYYQYAYQAVVLLLFYRLSRPSDRAILIASVVALQIVGIRFINIEPISATSTATPASVK